MQSQPAIRKASHVLHEKDLFARSISGLVALANLRSQNPVASENIISPSLTVRPSSRILFVMPEFALFNDAARIILGKLFVKRTSYEVPVVGSIS
jgi:hypothetical protein